MCCSARYQSDGSRLDAVGDDLRLNVRAEVDKRNGRAFGFIT
jgi:hypothetical protein